MAQGIFTKQIIRLRCKDCKSVNFHTRKNKKSVERKLEFKKYCNSCKGYKLHKESKK